MNTCLKSSFPPLASASTNFVIGFTFSRSPYSLTQTTGLNLDVYFVNGLLATLGVIDANLIPPPNISLFVLWGAFNIIPIIFF